MLKFVTSTSLLLLFAACSALAQNADSPVRNGGFENGMSDWWGQANDHGHAAAVKENSADGAACLKLDSEWVCQNKILIDGKKRYQISMKIRCDGTSDDSVYVQFSYRGGKLNPAWYGPMSVKLWGHDEPAIIATGGSHDWKEFSVVMQPPADADEALIYLRRKDDKGAAYFDDVKMQVTDAPVTRAPFKGVSNGGFENGDKSWWGEGLKAADSGVVKEGATEGSACLKLASGWVCQDKISIDDTTNYRISMKIRCDAAPENAAYVQLSFRGENVGAGWRGVKRVKLGGHTEPAIILSGGTHEWKDFSTVVETPKGADQMLIYLRKIGKEGTVYYDDVKVEPTKDPAVSAASLRRDELAAQWLAPAAPAPAMLTGVMQSADQKTESLTLADQGKTAYRIFVGDDTDVVSLNAAIELAENLEKITGVSFRPFAHDSAPAAAPLLVIGRDNPLTVKLCPDISYDTLGHDGFVIRTVGPNIVIAGATPRGTLYGVYWFLDHRLGVKWFAPDFTVVPSQSTLAISPINELQKPRFAYREIFSNEAHKDAYSAHNLLNGRSHGRSFSPSAPEINDWESWWTAKGGDANFFTLLGDAARKQHPEWFAGGQVAMMNTNMRQAMADAIIARLQQLKDYRSVWFNIGDMDWGWDMDPASQAFAKQHGGEPSAPRLDMVIDVANRVRKVLPEARFTFNAYHWSFTPPEGMTVPDYVLVFPMTIHVDYSHPLFEGPNEKLGQDIVGWTKIAKHVLVWDHTVNFFGYVQPTPNLYPICRSIQWLATLEPVMGYFAEDSWNTPGAEFAALRTWVAARLLWNPNQDYKKVINEYVTGYYGPAAPYITQYIDLTHESIINTGDTLREKTTPLTDYLNLDYVMAADKLMEQAHAAVADQPDYLKHVETTRLAVDYTILVRRFDLMATAQQRGIDWNPDIQNRMERFYSDWNAAGVREYKQGGNLNELKQLLAIERKTPEKPEIVRDLPDNDWREYSDLSFTRYGADVVADPAASDGAAIRLKGNNTVWATQFRRFKLPKDGQWDVYVAVRVDPADGHSADEPAVNVGSSPPMGRFNSATLGELSDGKYHWIKAAGSPLTYMQDDKYIVYVQPRQNVTRYIYVDGLVAIRHKD